MRLPIHTLADPRPLRLLSLLLLVSAFAGPATAATDPFYDQLYAEGRQALARGDHGRAQRDLRIACFGMLDDPAELAGCLTHLALAQAATNDRDAFVATVDRILEVERRFGAYSGLELPASTRRGFEERVAAWIPYETLATVPAFRGPARRQLEARVREMPAEERRGELERRLAAEPEDVTWLLMRAELELAAGQLQPASEAAARALALEPESPRARCLDARARLRLGDCGSLANLAACGDGLEELTEPRLRCLLAAGELAAAEQLVAALDTRARQRAPVRRLVRELRRAQKRAAKQPAPVPEAALEEPSADAEAAAEPVAEAVEQSSSLETPDTREPEPLASAEAAPEIDAEMEALRETLRSIDREAIEQAFERAREAADRRPQDREIQYLAAELAYRLSAWSQTVEHFRRGGSPDQPQQQFYFAVALYEIGEREAAAEQLERSLPRIEETAFVREYVEKILADG